MEIWSHFSAEIDTSDTGHTAGASSPETTHLTPTSSCEACSAFTRVAARTLAQSPICDQLHRGLQPFRRLHDCSGCFRLKRLPGGPCTHWSAPPSRGAHVKRTLRMTDGDVAVADCGPTTCLASGTTGVGAKGVIPQRALSRLHRSKQA